MPIHAPANTRLGQLQRGTGSGFLMALREPAVAAAEVLQCILRDPRQDPQTESRARYHAELAMHLALPIEPIVAQAETDFAAVDALAEMAARGSGQALDLLRGRRSSPVLRRHMAAYLRDYPAWATNHLPIEVVHDLAGALRDGDELILDVEIYPDFWRPFSGRIAGVREAFERAAAEAAAERERLPPPPARPELLPTAVLLDLLEANASREIEAQLALRTSAEDRALLAWRVEHGASARLFAAADALGRMGDPRLLELAETLFALADDRRDPQRMLDAQTRSRRAALGRYVASLPAERTLSLAREWWHRGGYFTSVAGRVFAQYAEAADREWLERAVMADLAGAEGLVEWRALEALRRLGDHRSLPVFAAVVERSSSSLARARALAGLALAPEEKGSVRLLAEALWDCEADAREVAVRHVVVTTPEVKQRLRALAEDPLADVHREE